MGRLFIFEQEPRRDGRRDLTGGGGLIKVQFCATRCKACGTEGARPRNEPGLLGAAFYCSSWFVVVDVVMRVPERDPLKLIVMLPCVS